MANVNTSQALKNVPSQAITTATSTALLVPSGTLAYSGYPSPFLQGGTGFVLVSDPDVQSYNPYATSPTYVNSSLDGQVFRLRLNCLVTTAGAYTFIPKIYQVPIASVIPTNISATATNDNLIVTGATLTAGAAGTFNYVLEGTFIWDSSSLILNGSFRTLANGTYTAEAASTQLTAVPVTGLNFIPFFTFGTAGANSVVVKEFTLERV